MSTAPLAVPASSGGNATDTVASPAEGERWTLLPAVVLRQAGFPFELLDGLADVAAVRQAAELRDAEAATRQRAARVKAAFKTAELADRASLASRLGYLRPFDVETVGTVAQRLPAPARTVLADYQATAQRLARQWQVWQDGHRARMARGANAVLVAFQADPLLRDALLLSNDANYPLFAQWLSQPGDLAGRRARKMVDLLTRYLQRFAAKNETHAHFGPIAVGRADAEQSGPSWHWGPPRRRVFFSHWAAERLAARLSGARPVADQVRPRSRPWAFPGEDGITLYAFTTADGLSADWCFRFVATVAATPAERYLFARCDGSRTVADLHADFNQRQGAGFVDALRFLVDNDLVTARHEVPVGDADPLAALEDLVRTDPDATAMLAGFRSRLAALATAAPPARPALVAELKERFTGASGSPANRGSGQHYADRSVFYEECHGPVCGFQLGHATVEFIEREMDPVFALALAGPRLRLLREGAVLRRWVCERFGAGAPVPLGHFYAAYFADRPALYAQCDEVDAEVRRLDRELTEVLLGSDPPDAVEVVVDPQRLSRFLERCPREPGALCNPDIMFAAADRVAFARGDFLAVVGDCHAVRELLSHSSLAPLVEEGYPSLADDVVAAYRRLLEPDEVLCDVARSHPDKTAAQVRLPIADLEIYGRSGKPRDQVLRPNQLYLVAGDRLELRAEGVPGRLRLLAPPSGGPSIRLDPLAPFAFPRRLGGMGTAAGGATYLPRVRTGRVVLQRRLWRVPAARLRGVSVAGAARNGDAAEFYAACSLRARHAMPRYVFAKTLNEPKPVFVDFGSPLLVRQLFRMARGTTGPVEISEMLPGPDQLWLTRQGGHFTTEIRCAVFSTGHAVPPPVDQSKGVTNHVPHG